MRGLIERHVADQVVKHSDFGEVREILRSGEYGALDLAVLEDIHRTVGHFHRGFDEIYFQLDGKLIIAVFDPSNGELRTLELERNEVCVIPRGVHHKVIGGSTRNRLCCICVPGFDPSDDNRSDRFEKEAVGQAAQ